AHAAELADDKQAHVVALRGRIGALTAAQPQLDLSASSTGAFSVAARGAGVAGAGAGFDPYASDANFLIGAFFVENAVAAAYRTLLAQSSDPADQAVLQSQLADAIYHGGLIRSLLDDQASADSSIGTVLTGAGTMLAAFDGSDVGDQTLAGANGASSNLLDADSRPIPFTRTNAQVLKALYLSSSGVGGFLPTGANGIAA
ncbi:ferritin-like domain-containing protein, partial [Sphingomonas bacterium]|uniref:ferritin-like domain-containing protein n=1 Tax=Sphingomonas bacterium TaxID=1895847 RepID=UPI00157692CD